MLKIRTNKVRLVLLLTVAAALCGCGTDENAASAPDMKPDYYCEILSQDAIREVLNREATLARIRLSGQEPDGCEWSLSDGSLRVGRSTTGLPDSRADEPPQLEGLADEEYVVSAPPEQSATHQLAGDVDGNQLVVELGRAEDDPTLRDDVAMLAAAAAANMRAGAGDNLACPDWSDLASAFAAATRERNERVLPTPDSRRISGELLCTAGQAAHSAFDTSDLTYLRQDSATWSFDGYFPDAERSGEDNAPPCRDVAPAAGFPLDALRFITFCSNDNPA